jgi:uncharacterized membrane protein YbhN (UPF0104 family)
MALELMRSESTRMRSEGRVLARYFWVILKNVIGWLLILLSLPVAISIPVPLATPMFLIGFALITFPGKRHLTSRVLRGKPIDLASRSLQIGIAVFALVLPPLVVWLFSLRKHSLFHVKQLGIPATIALYALAIAIGWCACWFGIRGINFLLRFAPGIRRRIRPWMRRRGINLLPPRHQRRVSWWQPAPPLSEEIIEIDKLQIRKARRLLHNVPQERDRAMRFFRKHLKQIIGVVITAGIFLWMFKPILHSWSSVHDRVLHTNLLRFLLASLMFATFLLVFRVVSWRKILASLGHRLPMPAAARIWVTSELARYLPGVIWQVVGRVYLVKPYGVSAAACSASQVLELSIFLLSNLLVALACLPWYAGRLSSTSHHWLWIATAVAPLLLLLLYPKIFYGAINTILRKLGKRTIENRVSGWVLLGLVAWAIVGLLWQALAIWVLMAQPHALNLGFNLFGLVIGAYCLAWCAGFLAAWAPGGIGVREAVLVWTLNFALPPEVQSQFVDQASRTLFLSFLSVLLRLWTIVGELILSSIAYGMDYRGALGREDAPGRTMSSKLPPVPAPVPSPSGRGLG